MEKSEKSQYPQHYDNSVPAPDYSTLEVAQAGNGYTQPPSQTHLMPQHQQVPQQIPQRIPQNIVQPGPHPAAPATINDASSYQGGVSPESPPQAAAGYYQPSVPKSSPIVPWSTFDGRNPAPVMGAYHPQMPPGSFAFAEPERRICGFKRKSFLIVSGLVALILLGIVLGASLGTTLGKNSGGGGNAGPAADGSSTSAPSSTPSVSPSGTAADDAKIILAESKLSALNWTDASSNECRAVFWQDNSTALMMSYWDSAQRQWTVTNVSDSAGANATARVGTPLAATVRATPYVTKYHPFMLALFYLGPGNTVEVVTSANPRGQKWKTGDLSGRNTKYSAHESSALAVLFSLCNGTCTGDMSVFYQNPDNKLMSISSADWSRPPVEVRPNIAPTSGIAVTASADKNASVGLQADIQQVYYQTNSVIQEVGKAPNDTAWVQKANTVIPSVPIGKPVDLSVVTWSLPDDSTGPRRKLVIARKPDGSLLANYWDNTSWQDAKSPNLNGAPGGSENFTSISLTSGPDLRVYGRTDRGIVCYKINMNKPFEWTLEDNVQLRVAPAQDSPPASKSKQGMSGS